MNLLFMPKKSLLHIVFIFSAYAHIPLMFLKFFASASLFTILLQIEGNHMFRDWEENLAIITANRTKDDELVIIHLGDCLWKEIGEV